MFAVPVLELRLVAISRLVSSDSCPFGMSAVANATLRRSKFDLASKAPRRENPAAGDGSSPPAEEDQQACVKRQHDHLAVGGVMQKF
jgi:hypothetical protein